MFINKDSQIYISFLDFANVCVLFNLFLTCFSDVVTIRPIIVHTINPAHAREILFLARQGGSCTHTNETNETNEKNGAGTCVPAPR